LTPRTPHVRLIYHADISTRRVNLRTKFEMSSFIDSKYVMWPQNLRWVT